MYLKPSLVICLFVFHSCTSMTLAREEGSSKILKLEDDKDKYGNYRYSFHTSNGIKREEIGQILSGDADGETFSARGYYSYLGDDGFEYVVSYVADERGFRPKVEKRIYVEYVDESYRGNEENFPNIDEENDKNATTTESALFIPTHVLASLAG